MLGRRGENVTRSEEPPGMELDEIDKEILEAAANGEPFHILCAPPWIKQFQNPREGVERIYRLFQQGLLACRRDSDSKWLQPGELSVEELVANAVQNQWYRDIAEIG